MNYWSRWRSCVLVCVRQEIGQKDQQMAQKEKKLFYSTIGQKIQLGCFEDQYGPASTDSCYYIKDSVKGISPTRIEA